MNIGDEVKILEDLDFHVKYEKGCIVEDLYGGDFHIKLLTGKYVNTIICKNKCDLEITEFLAYDVTKTVGYCGIEFTIQKKLKLDVQSESMCQCGAYKTFGENCPDHFHYDFCRLYREKREENV